MPDITLNSMRRGAHSKHRPSNIPQDWHFCYKCKKWMVPNKFYERKVQRVSDICKVCQREINAARTINLW